MFKLPDNVKEALTRGYALSVGSNVAGTFSFASYRDKTGGLVGTAACTPTVEEAIILATNSLPATDQTEGE